MNDPKRLLDEVDSHLARELLNAGRWSPWPPGIRRQRVLTALGVGLAVGTTKKLSFAAMTTWAKVAAIGCVVCAGAGGVVAYQALTDDSSAATLAHSQNSWDGEDRAHVLTDSAQAEAIAQATAVTRPQLETQAAVRAPERQQVAQDTAPAASPAARVATSGRAGVAKNERKDSKVRAELTLLDQARSELRSGRSEAAVATLGTYGQRFPRGILALEAEVLRIEALAAAGKTQEAAKRAQRVLERNPNSVVASRLKRFEAPR